MSTRTPIVEHGLLALTIALTAATAYIHFWVGGVLLTLNALGYAGLAVLVVGSAVLFRRALPLALMALAAYAAATIAGWLVMGPYFDIAYLAKAIELALIGTIGVWLWLARDETRLAVGWALSIATRALRVVSRRPDAAAESAESR